MQFFKKNKFIKKIEVAAYSIENIQLLIKTIQYRTYKFIYRIFVYLSYIYRIFLIDYRICIVIYDIRHFRISYTLLYFKTCICYIECRHSMAHFYRKSTFNMVCRLSITELL